MKQLDNLMCENTPEIVSTMTTEKKREFLKELVIEGKSSMLPGKTPWSFERLNKASEKVIDKLFECVKAPKPSSEHVKTDVLSRTFCVDNFNGMIRDINQNPLIANIVSQKMGEMVNSHNPMEIAGAYAVEKYGSYLAPAALFCEVFRHLDWQRFHQVAIERKMQAMQVEESSDQLPSMPEFS